jgi:sepiapterin reductase
MALQNMPSLCMYSVGKAARDSVMRSLACEEQNVRVLSYAPGPVDTQMPRHISTEAANKNTKEVFEGV